MSNESGAFPCDTCKRWSKEDQAFINVPHPVLIKQYNDKMGGVDLSDRMIAYYRIAATNKKMDYSYNPTHVGFVSVKFMGTKTNGKKGSWKKQEGINGIP